MYTTNDGLQLRWDPVERCPICQSHPDKHASFETFRDSDLLLHYVVCDQCGTVFLNPRMDQASSTAYYRLAYHQQKMPEPEAERRNEWVQAARANYLIDEAKRADQSVGRYLDIGSSRGIVMEAFIEAFNCESVGVEPGERLRRLCLGRGLDVRATLDELVDTTQPFDVVSLSHTLEHLAAPVQALQQIGSRLMTKSGLLLVEVPNLIWHQSLELTHVLAFTQQSLTYCLARANFKLVRFVKHGRPYSRRLPFFLLAAARPAADGAVAAGPTPPVAGLRLRRAVGRSLARLIQVGVAAVGGDRAPWQRSRNSAGQS